MAHYTISICRDILHSKFCAVLSSLLYVQAKEFRIIYGTNNQAAVYMLYSFPVFVAVMIMDDDHWINLDDVLFSFRT